jgi:hypothetical protein
VLGTVHVLHELVDDVLNAALGSREAFGVALLGESGALTEEEFQREKAKLG